MLRSFLVLNHRALCHRSPVRTSLLWRGYKTDAGDVEVGDFLDVSGKIYEVIGVDRVRHNSRGSALCQLDLKEPITKKKHTERYRVEQKVEVAEIDPITIKYKGKAETAGKLLFEDANGDDVELDVSWFGSAAPFFQEGQELTLRRYDGRPVDVSIYDGFVEFTVVDTPEWKKGDQANARPKKATLDNGQVIKVPTFVNNGDRIIVDIRKDPPEFERRIEE